MSKHRANNRSRGGRRRKVAGASSRAVRNPSPRGSIIDLVQLLASLEADGWVVDVDFVDP